MRLRIVGALTLFAGASLTSVGAQEPRADRIQRVERGLTPAIQIGPKITWTIEERLAHYQVPGLSLAVINDTRVEWTRQYGVRDANTREPVDAKTLLQVASITKPVAATVALKLVEMGVLDLDRDVNSYLKSWKVPENEFTRKEKVTLRRLLSHDAGLTVSGFRGYAEGEPVPSILQVLDGAPPANSAPIRVDKEPGSGFRYSGGGYTVLQRLIEDVTGRSLPELVEQMVLGPAGMNDSSLRFPLPEALAARRSSGHSRERGAFAGHAFLLGGSGCCGLWTTAADLAGFGVAIQRSLRGDKGALLGLPMVTAMATPASAEFMGLGFRIDRFGTERYLTHGGGNPGFSAFLAVHPTAGHGLAILANANVSGLPGEIIRSIAEEYGWKGLRAEKHSSVEAFLAQYQRIRREHPEDSRVSEAGLNRLGYELLGTGQKNAAVRLLEFAAVLFPSSANCRDSLAEAYAASGDQATALANYRKALDLLDRYPEPNRGYAAQREAVTAKVRALEQETAAKQER